MAAKDHGKEIVLNHPFNIGDCVRVSSEYHWAQSATGTVRCPPRHVLELTPGWEGHVRQARMRKGLIPFFWVEFDVPQVDADGDGPYQVGEVEGTYLSAAAYPRNMQPRRRGPTLRSGVTIQEAAQRADAHGLNAERASSSVSVHRRR